MIDVFIILLQRRRLAARLATISARCRNRELLLEKVAKDPKTETALKMTEIVIDAKCDAENASTVHSVFINFDEN